MKKVFKTIMATAAALAISISGMCMVSAGEVSPNLDGELKNETQIYLTVEDRLSAIINFGDMKFTYSLATNSWQGFDGTNNIIQVSNLSTCPMNLQFGMQILNSDLLDVGFSLTKINTMGEQDESNILCSANDTDYVYSENIVMQFFEDAVGYLTIANPDFQDIPSGYNSRDIGSITVKLTKASSEIV